MEAMWAKTQVGTNGIISTQDFPRETQYVDDDFPTDFPAIAPFLADIDTSHSRGRILYREDTSGAVLSLAARYVRTGFPLSGSSFTLLVKVRKPKNPTPRPAEAVFSQLLHYSTSIQLWEWGGVGWGSHRQRGAGRFQHSLQVRKKQLHISQKWGLEVWGG